MSQKHLQEERKGASVACFTARNGHARVRRSSALGRVSQTAEGALAEGCAEFGKAACRRSQRHAVLQVCCKPLLWGCSEEATSVLLPSPEFSLCLWQQIRK